MATSPEFFVNGRHGAEGERVSFSRVVSGPDEGAVWVTSWRGEDNYDSVRIDAASWASVLAEVSAAPHDGESFAVAKDFHAGRIGAKR